VTQKFDFHCIYHETVTVFEIINSKPVTAPKSFYN